VCVSGGVDPAILTGCEANGRLSYGVNLDLEGALKHYYYLSAAKGNGRQLTADTADFDLPVNFSSNNWCNSKGRHCSIAVHTRHCDSCLCRLLTQTLTRLAGVSWTLPLVPAIQVGVALQCLVLSVAVAARVCQQHKRLKYSQRQLPPKGTHGQQQFAHYIFATVMSCLCGLVVLPAQCSRSGGV
jgi:hypothetical protein